MPYGGQPHPIQSQQMMGVSGMPTSQQSMMRQSGGPPLQPPVSLENPSHAPTQQMMSGGPAGAMSYSVSDSNNTTNSQLGPDSAAGQQMYVPQTTDDLSSYSMDELLPVPTEGLTNMVGSSGQQMGGGNDVVMGNVAPQTTTVSASQLSDHVRNELMAMDKR